MKDPLVLILGVISAALLILVLNHDSGSSFGLDNDRFAKLVYLAVFGGVVAAGLFGRGVRFNDATRHIAIWIFLLVALVAGYQYRYELQDFGNRVTAGLIPGSPLSTVGADGRATVMIDKASNGHFDVTALVNGKQVSMLVDTGATTTVLTNEDAARAGYDVGKLSFSIPVTTANGMALGAEIVIDDLAVGGISRMGSRAMVAEQGKLDQSLLGMSFLGALTGFDVRGDRLVLHD
jgi:aspartyl protease family protein